VALGSAWLAPLDASAHFHLTSPPAKFEQNALGDPQKAPPCGDAGASVPSGMITTVQAGDTITIEIEETIFHPGHYRIAIAGDDGVFPDEPPVTPGPTDCGSAPIDPAPSFPVLADGVWEHDGTLAGPQTVEVTIPADFTCENCTLQIIQFMSNHALNNPGGCYYHHCAAIKVEAGPVGGTTSPGDDSGGTTDPGGDTGPTTRGDGTAGTSNGSASADGGDDGADDAPASSGIGIDTDAGQSEEDDGGCSCRTDGREGGVATIAGLLLLLGLRRRRVR
jgi:MYXO-CTERM domain-containing protein